MVVNPVDVYGGSVVVMGYFNRMGVVFEGGVCSKARVTCKEEQPEEQ